MNLDINDAVALMAVSDDTIYRWIRDDGLPCHRVDGQYRFNREQLLEWATARGVKVSPAMFAAPDASGAMPATFFAALAAGGIHYGVPGANKHAALAEAIGKMPLPEDMDRDLLLEVMLARESLGSTGIGDGIAIPHVRNPIVMHIAQPLVTLCFLATPVEFDAVDGKPVHTLFTIVSPTVKMHLHLLSRLAFTLRQPEFAGLIARQGPGGEILACASAIEGKVADPATGGRSKVEG